MLDVGARRCALFCILFVIYSCDYFSGGGLLSSFAVWFGVDCGCVLVCCCLGVFGCAGVAQFISYCVVVLVVVVAVMVRCGVSFGLVVWLLVVLVWCGI